jgi:enoyl-CoA hydratase
MNYENLLFETSGNAIIITINRPQALNALNSATMEDLGNFFRDGYKKYPEIKGVILQGAGDKAFVAGADIKEFQGLDAEGGRQMAARGHQVFNKIERFHLPVVAAIQGFALGGGCELAMACHLRVASEKARFGQPEVNLGLIPGYGGTQRLIQYIGKTKAMELLMTAEMINAEQALQLGLVNKVVPPEMLLEESIRLIEQIATKAPLAISRIIQCVNAYYVEGVNGFSTEIEEFGNSATTADFREGASAFVEKRKANFTGI